MAIEIICKPIYSNIDTYFIFNLSSGNIGLHKLYLCFCYNKHAIYYVFPFFFNSKLLKYNAYNYIIMKTLSSGLSNTINVHT